MTTKTKKATKPEQKRNPKNDKFRVIPNLSLRGKDILVRMNNNTLGEGSFHYSQDPMVDETRRMSKIDVARKYVENARNIEKLQKVAGETEALKKKREQQIRDEKIAQNAIKRYQQSLKSNLTTNESK